MDDLGSRLPFSDLGNRTQGAVCRPFGRLSDRDVGSGVPPERRFQSDLPEARYIVGKIYNPKQSSLSEDANPLF